MEIERKFSILKMPEELEKYEKEEIEQGYLCIKPTVRIRKANNEYTLNYKWKQKGLEEKIAIQNIEYTMPLTKENYEFLLIKIENNLIKMRVWERGAGETLACGTGACETAEACHLNGLTDRNVYIELLRRNINNRLV